MTAPIRLYDIDLVRVRSDTRGPTAPQSVLLRAPRPSDLFSTGNARPTVARSPRQRRQDDERALHDLTKALELTPESDREMKFLVLEMRGEAFQGNRQFDDFLHEIRLRGN